ncbi:hypothetical protein EVAR_34716_1 [Eumeta japonica]|uniref:Uncharacterized protein n=1 Tax=Eumeta variegata TaxID=151549 RepID=A0A4C1XEG0_EUMVA|nr:hypothetical protein EVAR_34716_1 [Eumeta japonica]
MPSSETASPAWRRRWRVTALWVPNKQVPRHRRVYFYSSESEPLCQLINGPLQQWKNFPKAIGSKKQYTVLSAKSASWTPVVGRGILFTYTEYSSGESVESYGTTALIGFIDE